MHWTSPSSTDDRQIHSVPILRVLAGCMRRRAVSLRHACPLLFLILLASCAFDEDETNSHSNAPEVSDGRVTEGNTIRVEAESFSAMSGIATEGCSDSTGCGQNIGWFDPNDWFELKVAVPQAGRYKLSMRTATPNVGAKVDVKNGGATLATIAVPNSGNWQVYTTTTAATIELAAGTQTLRFVNSGSSSLNVNYILLGTEGGACGGSTGALPSGDLRVEAESFSAMSGIATEGCSDSTGCGQNIGWFDPNDWFELKVAVPQAGRYKLSMRTATPNVGAKVDVKNGGATLATIEVPKSGNWQVYTTTTATTLELAAGTQTLRFVNSGSSSLNVNYILLGTDGGDCGGSTDGSTLGKLDYYDGTAGPVSDKFEFTIQQGTVVAKPHVYQINDTGHGDNGRSMSWIDVAQGELDKLRVTVRRIDGKTFPENVHIRPSRYGIEVKRLDGGQSIQFDVMGNEKWISVHYGDEPLNYTYPAGSSLRDALFVFVNDMPLPVPSDVNLEFKPGVHNINNQADGRGILNPDSPTEGYKIYLHRGAWVRGKIDLFKNAKGDKFYHQQILGNGVLSGEGFAWANRDKNPVDSAQMVKSFQQGTISGITVVQASNHQIHTWHNHTIDQVKALGWHNNNDAIHLRGGSPGKPTTVSDSFFRAGDDTVRIMEDSDILVERTVVWQNHNGGSFVIAHEWGTEKQENVTFQGCDIIEMENPIYDPKGQAHRVGLGVYKYVNNHAIHNITFRDIRFDAPETIAAMRVGLIGSATGSIDGVHFDNIQIFGHVTSSYFGDKASNIDFKNVRIKKDGAMTLLTSSNKDQLVDHFFIASGVGGVSFSP
jgi:Carbohydrate binding module (family 6)